MSPCCSESSLVSSCQPCSGQVKKKERKPSLCSHLDNFLPVKSPWGSTIILCTEIKRNRLCYRSFLFRYRHLQVYTDTYDVLRYSYTPADMEDFWKKTSKMAEWLKKARPEREFWFTSSVKVARCSDDNNNNFIISLAQSLGCYWSMSRSETHRHHFIIQELQQYKRGNMLSVLYVTTSISWGGCVCSSLNNIYLNLLNLSGVLWH